VYGVAFPHPRICAHLVNQTSNGSKGWGTASAAASAAGGLVQQWRVLSDVLQDPAGVSDVRKQLHLSATHCDSARTRAITLIGS